MRGGRIEPSLEAREDYRRMPFVRERFQLPDSTRGQIESLPSPWGWQGLSEALYYRSYSREKRSGGQERWADTVIRFIEGVLSIRKDYCLSRRLAWDEGYWRDYGVQMALAAAKFEWSPPGRGLWAMGTDYAYERGSACLTNCAFVDLDTGKDIAHALGWAMDMLMCGAGVGFSCTRKPIKMELPSGPVVIYDVCDTREAWVESYVLLVRSYLYGTNPIEFLYGRIRDKGTPLQGIGGRAAGSDPLKQIHCWARETCERYVHGEISVTVLKANLANFLGVCVSMGGIRRSSEILLGSVHDQDFLDLKNLERFPEREPWYWASNNTVLLETHEDFLAIPRVAEGIRRNGEPGVANLIAMRKFARFGRENYDPASGLNPCAEICLETFETCIVNNLYPSRCKTYPELVQAAKFATFYDSTVALLPTHRPETNRVVAKNRRIGVSIAGLADWLTATSDELVTRTLRDVYKEVKAENERLAREAGVPASIRVTTVKPDGSVAKLPGCSEGLHAPKFPHAIRRMGVQKDHPVVPVLRAAGFPCEPSATMSDLEVVFEFPIAAPDGSRTSKEQPIWEQISVAVMMQREWSDNAVSITGEFDPETEGADMARVVARNIPMLKSFSALPRSTGAYKQMPYEEISKEQYLARKRVLRPLNWTNFHGDGEDEKYCQGGMCRTVDLEKAP